MSPLINTGGKMWLARCQFELGVPAFLLNKHITEFAGFPGTTEGSFPVAQLGPIRDALAEPEEWRMKGEGGAPTLKRSSATALFPIA
jgi:hypothetical protein